MRLCAILLLRLALSYYRHIKKFKKLSQFCNINVLLLYNVICYTISIEAAGIVYF